MERDPPGVVAGVRLRQRHLLLPGGDADHHLVVGDAVRLDVEKIPVPAQLELLLERLEGREDGPGRCRCVVSGPGRRALGQQKEVLVAVQPAERATRSSTQARSGSLSAAELDVDQAAILLANLDLVAVRRDERAVHLVMARGMGPGARGSGSDGEKCGSSFSWPSWARAAGPQARAAATATIPSLFMWINAIIDNIPM